MILLGFIGTTEVVVILIIALLVFGPQKLPEVGRQIGSLYQELNRMRGDVQKALDLNEYTRYDSNPYNSSYTYDTPAETQDLHEYTTPQIEAPAADTHDGAVSTIAPPGPVGTVASSSPFTVRSTETQWHDSGTSEQIESASAFAHSNDTTETTSTTTSAVEPSAVPHKESTQS